MFKTKFFEDCKTVGDILDKVVNDGMRLVKMDPRGLMKEDQDILKDCDTALTALIRLMDHELTC